MKRLPHIPKSGRSKTVLSLAICLCFGTAAVTSGFGQNEPKPTSIEEKTKIHRLATTKRAIYDAFAYMNRIPEKAEEDESPEDFAGRILGRLANQEGRILVKLPKGMDRQAYLGYKTFLESEGTAKVGNCIACHAPPDFTDLKEHVSSQSDSKNPTPSLRNLAKRKVNIRQVIMAKMAASETKRAGKAEKIDEAYGKIRLNKGDLHQLMAFLNLLNDGNTPFSFDVTKAVTEGENTVRLKGIVDWAMNPQNKTPNTPPMPSFYFAGQKNLMIIARQILGNLLTQLPSPLKYLIQRAGGNAVSLGHRLFY